MGIIKEKNKEEEKRFLISVTVLGSTGAFMLAVYEHETVESVIKMVLKAYDRQGRIPKLGFDVNDFMLYDCSHYEEALRPFGKDIISGSGDVRKLTMYKKTNQETGDGEEKHNAKALGTIRRSASRKIKPIKDWFDKSMHSKVLSY